MPPQCNRNGRRGFPQAGARTAGIRRDPLRRQVPGADGSAEDVDGSSEGEGKVGSDSRPARAELTWCCALLDLFKLQRRWPAQAKIARKFGRNPLASFLPKDIVTPNVGTSKPSGDASTHGDPVRASSPSLCDRVAVEARLLDVATSDSVAEIVIVLRGRVRPWRGAGRGLWRVRIADGHHRIVSTQSVIAVTPVKKRPRSRSQSGPEDEAADRLAQPLSSQAIIALAVPSLRDATTERRGASAGGPVCTAL